MIGAAVWRGMGDDRDRRGGMSLRMRLLPTSAGDTSGAQPLTTFIINETIALDAGSLGYALTAEEMAKVRNIILTHAHLDHTASLPTAIAEVFPLLRRPWLVHAEQATIDAVRQHLFNDAMWVDFSKLPLLHSPEGSIQFKVVKAREPFILDGVKFTGIPVEHPVPTLGYLIETETESVLFTADTCRTDEIWEAANAAKNLRAVFVECSFPNRLEGLANASGHLTPNMVADEVAKLKTRVPVYCVHLKPSMREQLLKELKPLAKLGITPAEVGKVYEWGFGKSEI